MAVSLDYAAVAEDVRDFLSVFYEFRADVPLFEDIERADFAQFRVLLKGRGHYTFCDGVRLPAPAIHIVGPSTGNTAVRVEGPVHMFGAGLLPIGWSSLLNFEASMLVNRVVDARTVFGNRLDGVVEAFEAAETLEAKVAIGNALARSLTQRVETMGIAFTKLVDHWLASERSPDVAALVDASGMSRRQVERNCNRYYGSPPKLLARKYRALKAAIALAKGEATVEELVEEFYDQSHFIREVKHFTGVTPGRIVDDLPTLARLTLKRTELVDLPPLITKT